MPESSLRQIQQWMELVLVTRGDLQQKLQSSAETFHLEIDDVIASKRGLSAHRRLDIYASGYVLRLLECMKCDYPGLQAFMGEELFEIFAKAYIVSRPPESWSLLHLSQQFPQFLRDTQPKPPYPEGENSDLLELPAEIATLERIKVEVLHAEGTEQHPAASPGGSLSGALDFLFDTAGFQTPPCLRLVRLKFPLVDFLNRVERHETPVIPARKSTCIAVTRKDFRLRMLEIEPWQHSFLQACTEPLSIQQSAEKVAGAHGLETNQVLAQLFLWLPVALEQGCLVRSVTVHPSKGGR